MKLTNRLPAAFAVIAILAGVIAVAAPVQAQGDSKTPSGLTSSINGDGNVVLNWTPGSNPNYAEQAVLRRQPRQAWTTLATLTTADNSYTDTTAKARSGKYIYRIKGLKANGKGGISNRAKVVIPKTKPTDLTASVDANGVTLSWTPGNNQNYVRQVVLRRVPGTPINWTETELATGVATYTDDTVAAGTRYIYRVKALKANNKGGMTNAAVVVAQ